jgi:hypothetical protein
MRSHHQPDRFSAAIDSIAERTIDAVLRHARRRLARRRERNPLARVGLDIISSARAEIIESETRDALGRLTDAVASAWWMASPVGARYTSGPTGHVVAAGGHLVWIQTDQGWRGQIDAADLAGQSLLDLAGKQDLQAKSIVCVPDEPLQPGWSTASSGRRVGVTPTDQLADMVHHELKGCGPYDPDLHPQLSRIIYSAQRVAAQRDAAMLTLATELDPCRWVVAHRVRLHGLERPIGVLAAGTTGIYVCEPQGIDRCRAASAALEGAAHLARINAGLTADVIPVVLCDRDEHPHQLQISDGQRAWALPVGRAVALIEQAHHRGLSSAQITRTRRPAPGWEYTTESDGDGWTYRVRYDHARHDPGI